MRIVKAGKSFISYIWIFLAMLPFAKADTLGDFIGRGTRDVFDVLTSTYGRATITLLLWFFIIYSILLAAMRFVKPFQSDNGVSKQGKVVAFSIAALSTLGLFFGFGMSYQQVIANILETSGLVGTFALAFLIFGLIFFGIGKNMNPRWTIAFMALGLALLFPSMITGNDKLANLGLLLFIIGLIGYIISLFSGRKDSEGPGPDREDGEEGPDRTSRQKYGNVNLTVYEEGTTNGIGNVNVYLLRRGTSLNPARWGRKSRWIFYGRTDPNGNCSFRARKGNRNMRVEDPSGNYEEFRGDLRIDPGTNTRTIYMRRARGEEREPEIRRVIPSSRDVNSGSHVLRIEGRNLDLIQRLSFAHSESGNHFLHQTNFPRFRSHTTDAIEVEVNLNRNCGHDMPADAPTNCEPGSYNLIYNWGDPERQGRFDNAFIVNAGGEDRRVPVDITFYYGEGEVDYYVPGAPAIIYIRRSDRGRFNPNGRERFVLYTTEGERIINADVLAQHYNGEYYFLPFIEGELDPGHLPEADGYTAEFY